jgi:hypothetical protein
MRAVHAHLHRRALLAAVPLVLAACVEASSHAPDAPDWKRNRAPAQDISDASLSAHAGHAQDRYADPFWSTCYVDFQPTADPVSDLDRLGFICGAPRGYAAAAPIHVGSQAAEEPAERLLFRAKKGRCYRLFAIGAAGVRDLDVSVIGPDGRLVAADLSKDRWSVVPPRGPWCPEEEGPFAVDVAVAEGQGPFALGVWGSEVE